MIKPFGSRVVLRVDIIRTKAEDGSEKEEPSQEAKVIESNVDGIKKGDKVFYNPYGAVSVNSMKTKKLLMLIVDAEDVYGVLK